MVEIESSFFDNLLTAKRLWDNGVADKFLKTSGNFSVDAEAYYEIAWDGMSSVFRDVRNYCNEKENEYWEVHVCFDPLIDRFFKLCQEYEKCKGLAPEGNPIRTSGARAVCDSFGFWDFSCDWMLCDEMHGRARLVIVSDENFCGLHILPLALAGARHELENQLELLEAEIKEAKRAKKPKKQKAVIKLPEKKSLKEAA